MKSAEGKGVAPICTVDLCVPPPREVSHKYSFTFLHFLSCSLKGTASLHKGAPLINLEWHNNNNKKNKHHKRAEKLIIECIIFQIVSNQ